MQRSLRNSNSLALSTAITDTMGHPYRTPSPIREPYISSSHVNSPQTALQTRTSRSDIYAPAVAAAESDKHCQRHTVASARLQNGYRAESDLFDQKSSSAAVAASSEHIEGLPVLEEPYTPKKKCAPILFHGLPSPETPMFHDETPSERAKKPNDLLPLPNQRHADTSSEDVDEVMIAVPQTSECAIQNDEILARKLEASLSPNTTRRSTRLRMQPKPTFAVLKTARKLPPSPVTSDHDTQPEFSIVPVKADPIPFEGLPTVHSLSWQIQYPPGGSTHPSYPYPAMDPCLLFHQAFVPIIGGLPDFTLVPKLVLPMGWKHVSWSGLLPIAFDPYRQAFKLTPVGPIPLTCEELQQQGLQKYVPGGESHPEFGLLPEMLKLSDGSDAEIYNFDGVDWTLPWAGQMDFHTPCRIMDKRYSSDEIKSPTDSYICIPMITYPWSEAHDCPNKVFDLNDAWRWLSNKETNPTADFIPTPEKTWHRSGAFRSARRLKSPVPELMMLATQSTPTTPNIQLNPLLQNQDSMKDKNHFCPFKSIATPCTVNITLLGDTEFTIIELLSYFPQHYCWGHAAERMAKAGVMGSMIREEIIMTRGLQGDEMMKASSIACAAMLARKRDCVKVKEAEDMDIGVGKNTPTPAVKSTVIEMTMSYTAEEWVYDVWEKIDYPLLALAHGLQSLPTGPDAGPLTALILWCREKGRYRVLLSEVPALLKEAEIEPLIEPGQNGCPDGEVVGMHAEALKKDRLRVVRDAGVNKRALGGSVGDTQGKRRKLG
ncbi:hypothetical protein G6011_00505 [Alternaria panax]|uniref:Uncharacterized protein n=1 Tax=Alternaria panax TaxID=48097 RepID=A0AAD4NV43_9PLEO|nr:hypothetical protein G6011_00505 [Alternaria panax]